MLALTWPRLCRAQPLAQALSRACALEKLRCDEQAGAVQERHAWNVPAAAADAAADWADFSVRSNAAGDGAEGGGERRAASAGADKAAACGAPHDPQAIVNSAGSYLMLLQQGCVRLFALFCRDWSPEQVRPCPALSTPEERSTRARQRRAHPPLRTRLLTPRAALPSPPLPHARAPRPRSDPAPL